MNIAPRLPAPEDRKALRLAAGITLQEIANEIEVATSAVHRWEQSGPTGRTPKGRNLRRYAAYLESITMALHGRAGAL